MASYNTNYVYLLDEDGNSTNGKIDELVQNSAGTVTETGVGGTPDDGIASLGEEFNVVFTDPATQALYGGTYTYVGHWSPFSGFIGEDENGEFVLFTNNAIPIGTNQSGFVAEDTVIDSTSDTVSVYSDDTLTTLVATYDGATAFSDALAAAVAGQAIAVDDPVALGDVGAQSVTVDSLMIIANVPFNASLSLEGSAQNLTLSGTSGINVVATSAEVTITGDEGNNNLKARALSSSDFLDGRGGSDILTGGQGNDTLVAGDGQDRLFGNADDDQLEGGAGNDDLSGGYGQDTLIGGAGADRFVFEQGVINELGVEPDLVADFDAADDKITIAKWANQAQFLANLSVRDDGTGGCILSEMVFNDHGVGRQADFAQIAGVSASEWNNSSISFIP